MEESCEEDSLIGDFEYYQSINEFAALYKLLLSLEYCDSNDDITLDIRDFEEYYREDNYNLIDLFKECKKSIVSTSIAHKYIFHHVLNQEEILNPIFNLITRFNEDTFIDTILIPLLEKMSFRNVIRVKHHGPSEYGIDIGPFYEIDTFDTHNFFGVQVKAVNLHTNSGTHEGNVSLIAGQIEIALNHDFLIQGINDRIRLTKVYLITNKSITSDAKSFLNTKFKEKIIILDGTEISRLVTKYGLLDYPK